MAQFSSLDGGIDLLSVLHPTVVPSPSLSSCTLGIFWRGTELSGLIYSSSRAVLLSGGET